VVFELGHQPVLVPGTFKQSNGLDSRGLKMDQYRSEMQTAESLVLSDGTRRFALPTLRARAVALPRAN
jgi:hypothetical protein